MCNDVILTVIARCSDVILTVIAICNDIILTAIARGNDGLPLYYVTYNRRKDACRCLQVYVIGGIALRTVVRNDYK